MLVEPHCFLRSPIRMTLLVMVIVIGLAGGLGLQSPAIAEGDCARDTRGFGGGCDWSKRGNQHAASESGNSRPISEEYSNIREEITGDGDTPISCAENAVQIDLAVRDYCDYELYSSETPEEPRTVEDLVEEASASLKLPTVSAQIRPYLTFTDGRQGGITGMPLWMWIDDSSWQSPDTARVEAGPLWAEIKAKPRSVRWSFGNGDSVVCNGPGTPYTQGMDALEGSPDCGYTYRKTSKDEPRGSYFITVEVSWEVSWTASDGTSEAFDPAAVQTTVPYVVMQARSQLVAP